METAHRLDPLSHVITLSLAVVYDGADRFAEATPFYAQGLAQSPEAFYAWTALIGHELALGRLPEAVVALRRSGAVDSAEAARIERGLLDPASRNAIVEEIGRTGDLDAAAALHRWFRGNEATIAMLKSRIAAGRGPNLKLNVLYPVLGPRLRADPRLQTLMVRDGNPQMAGVHIPGAGDEPDH